MNIIKAQLLNYSFILLMYWDQSQTCRVFVLFYEQSIQYIRL